MATLSSPYLGSPGIGSMSSNSTPFYPLGGLGYYNPYIGLSNPYAGVLTGAANVTAANGQYLIQTQQARVTQQQANQASLDTRRRIVDQLRYERSITPTPEDLRLQDIETSLSRARHSPPLTEVLNGDALNSLFNILNRQQQAGNRGPRVDLNEDMLLRINLTPQGTAGNAGLLQKDGKDLRWPLALQRPEFRDARKVITDAIPDAIQQIKFTGEAKLPVLESIKSALTSMKELVSNSKEMTWQESLDSLRYLNSLNDAYKALQSPDAKNFFNDRWQAKGKTVAELIDNMSKSGLRFAPAAPGEDSAAAYRALLDRLTAYDDGMQAVAKQP
jgi:hypothetical protein